MGSSLLLVALCALLAPVSAFTSPSVHAHGVARRASAQPAMATDLRTGDMVKIISGDSKVRACVRRAWATRARD